MNTSPWNYYGRLPAKQDADPSPSAPDPTLGAEKNVTRTRAQLVEYLRRTLAEYSDIRAGQSGYQKMIEDALQPPPRPESIEETLHRLAGRKRRDGNAP
ncbi:MAG TPA: hypothetical protein VLN59_17120 [Burkholderiales bacterium]|nr:hypothetical protein [Burkholderiales bacterium]